MCLLDSKNDNQIIVNQVLQLARDFHSSDTTGHDWWHIYRVWQMAKHIAEQEGAKLLVVELAALLHDMDDHKVPDGDEENLPNARRILQGVSVQPSTANAVFEVIKQVSFKGAGVDTKPASPEACIVQDADRLDAIGAIGVARAFAYGGSKRRQIYNPESKPNFHTSYEEYKSSTGSTLNHFYEKLFLLKDRLNTSTAKSIAEHRHCFMQQFVEQFLEEWNMKDTDSKQTNY